MGLFGKKQKKKELKSQDRMQTKLSMMEMQRQSFIKNGFELYQIIGSRDGCEICKSMNGKVFEVKDFEPGKTAPPFCSNCRCSVSSYMDKDKYNRWLNALANGKDVRFKDFK